MAWDEQPRAATKHGDGSTKPHPTPHWDSTSTRPKPFWQHQAGVRQEGAGGGWREGRKREKMSFPAAPAVWRLIGCRLVWSGAESLIPNPPAHNYWKKTRAAAAAKLVIDLLSG